MAPTPPRLKILSVGGNAISAFLSWRLSATNACDVTLVWKAGFETVAQYGITFKSSNKALGQERFKPRQVVRTPDEAAQTSKVPYDYVLLCIKALPDVYDLASVIEPVVSPQHTCILVNTTHSLGVESYLESRFPTNVVLSLVSGAELTQLNTSEFEHTGSTEFWVGPANKNPGIPASIQSDMAEALAMTLNSGQVDCKVSTNIRQQQYDRMIGPIAFQPASVLFETADHAELLEKKGVRPMITGIIDELVTLAEAQGCSFPETFSENVIAAMTKPNEAPSLMFQDYTARRPLEIETFLGAPVKIAKEVGINVPRIETLYALLHNLNVTNQRRPINQGPASPQVAPPRMSSAGMNGHMAGPPAPRPGMRPGSRAPSVNGGPPPMRPRGPSAANGFSPRMPNGHGPPGPPGPPGPGRGPPQMTRRPSMEGNDLEEFSHVMLYDNIPEGQLPEYGGYPEGGPTPSSSGDISLREREFALRQRELALREQEFHMRRGPPPPRRGPPPGAMYDDDDDEDGDYFVSHGPPSGPQIDPDNFDMMSVTSRRTRKAPSAQQLRQNPEMMANGGNGRTMRNPFSRPKPQNRTSARLMADVPGLHDSIMSNPLMAYSSDRYGGVDRAAINAESRTNSLTAERLQELSQNGQYPGPYPPTRRASQSPGNPLSSPQPGPRRSPPGQFAPGRPSPPGMSGQMPRHSPGIGGMGAPQRMEQHAGVSHHFPQGKPRPQERSLTGSASASAGSGDSAHSARLDSDPSAHSSQSSLGPRPPIGVR